MQKEHIESVVRAFVQEISGADARHARLLIECGIDSVSAVELVGLLEAHFDIEVPDEVIARLKSVDEVVSYIAVRLSEAGTPGGVALATPAGATS